MKNVNNVVIVTAIVVLVSMGAIILTQISFAQETTTNKTGCDIWEFHQALQDRNPNYLFCPETGDVWMVEDNVKKLVVEKK